MATKFEINSLSLFIDDQMFYWNRTNGETIESMKLSGPISDHTDNKQSTAYSLEWGLFFSSLLNFYTDSMLMFKRELGPKKPLFLRQFQNQL